MFRFLRVVFLLFCPEIILQYGNVAAVLTARQKRKSRRGERSPGWRLRGILLIAVTSCCNEIPLCLFLSAVIYLQLGSSLSPFTMTGGTCQRIGAVAPWRKNLLKKYPAADIINLVRFRRDEDGKRKILYSR